MKEALSKPVRMALKVANQFCELAKRRRGMRLSKRWEARLLLMAVDILDDHGYSHESAKDVLNKTYHGRMLLKDKNALWKDTPTELPPSRSQAAPSSLNPS